jgi:hypothetical protein
MWNMWHSGTRKGFSPFSSFPLSIISAGLHTHVSYGGWITGPLVPAVQRHSLTPLTWTRRLQTSVSQSVVHSSLSAGPQAVSKETALQKLYKTRSELKIHPYIFVINVPLFWVWRVLWRWSTYEPTASEVVRDCWKFEKHCSRPFTEFVIYSLLSSKHRCEFTVY